MKITRKHLLGFTLLLIFFFTLLFFYQNIYSARAGSFLDMANEGGLTEIGQKAYGGEQATDIRITVARIIKVFLGFLGVIFVFLIVIGGYKYMTSQGNEEKVKEAVGQIKVAIIGLFIIISSYAITTFIADRIKKDIIGT